MGGHSTADKEDLIAAAENERQSRIDAANDFMNRKQWPGKAAIGRLKGDELAQYNLWLDYLEALEAVDTSSAPDINWPVPRWCRPYRSCWINANQQGLLFSI